MQDSKINTSWLAVLGFAGMLLFVAFFFSFQLVRIKACLYVFWERVVGYLGRLFSLSYFLVAVFSILSTDRDFHSLGSSCR